MPASDYTEWLRPRTVEELLDACQRSDAQPDLYSTVPTSAAFADLAARVLELENMVRLLSETARRSTLGLAERAPAGAPERVDDGGERGESAG